MMMIMIMIRMVTMMLIMVRILRIMKLEITMVIDHDQGDSENNRLVDQGSEYENDRLHKVH